MRIGELAARANCLIETIRFYERAGLLDSPTRSANNYRVYTQRHLDRLSFVRHCRALDMALDEIRALLALQDDPDQGCASANTLLDKQIAHVAGRIATLRTLETQLRDLRSYCEGSRTAQSCGILHALTETPVRPTHAAGDTMDKG
jgi:Cd(II)/Pb(II)-responsive transcriptional regulator